MVKRTIKRIIAEQNVSTKAKRAKVSQPAQKSITLKFYPLTNNKIREPIQLPKIYLDTHTETFIDGLKFIVDKDPGLYSSLNDDKAFGICLKNSDKENDVGVMNGFTRVRELNFYFEKLADGLISQQISGHAAAAIRKKIVGGLCNDGEEFPSPETFYQHTEEELRVFGLSHRKAEYIRRLSKAFMSDIELGEIDEGIQFSPSYFENIDDASLRVDLEKFKGIGPWSSSMFAMFALERLDIFEPGDLGIRRGFTQFLKKRPALEKEARELLDSGVIPRTKKVSRNKKKDKYISDVDLMNVIADQFKPYRTIFMLLLWRISDTSVEAMSR
ncbi:hypothetical protein HII13_002895 [Brettanomyces bruxellensis]|nr:hypothetical protein HII13_002895 [Brettanomyces bruxellensis]